MHRATIIYVGMLAVSALGLWAVLSRGNRIQAPEDLAGKWTLAPSVPAGPFLRIAPYGPGLTIDQSGKFFQVAFDNGPRLDLRLAEPAEVMPLPGKEVLMSRIELATPGWVLKAWGKPGGDEWMMWLVGPEDSQSGKWLAKRVTRTYATAKPTAGGGGH